ncbi:hypothetical protein OIO90_003701 [Microbotryomycetes sp. JL221]|nr:hypothetical protein OIO90_003701 [Microbotryomycetes sp. JL221]
MDGSSPRSSVAYDEDKHLLHEFELERWPSTDNDEPNHVRRTAANSNSWLVSTTRSNNVRPRTVKLALAVALFVVVIVASTAAYIRHAPRWHRAWQQATARETALRHQLALGFDDSTHKLDSLTLTTTTTTSGQDQDRSTANRTFKVHQVLPNGAPTRQDPPSPPLECVWTRLHEARYAPLMPKTYPLGAVPFRLHSWQPHTLPRHKLKYFIAVNLYNSTDVVTTIVDSLTRVITMLGPDRFHVSIYENGWTHDNPWHDQTPLHLYLFAKQLQTLGVGHTIVSDSTRKAGWTEFKRIPGLAQVRNEAMKPLYDAPAATFDRVIFLNDVHFCPADLLELMYQHEVQDADQSCGMDYKSIKIPVFEPDYPILFYDVWVARDMNGRTLQLIEDGGKWDIPTPLFPFAPQGDQHRFYDNLPVQVYSCWNGMTVIDADLFKPVNSDEDDTITAEQQETSVDEVKGIRFHAMDDSDIRSECFLFSQDVWRTRAHNKTVSQLAIDKQQQQTKATIDNDVVASGGRGAKIQIVPRSSVAYFKEDYEIKRQDWNLTALDLTGQRLSEQRNRELIQWKNEPPERVHAYLFAQWERRVDIAPY